MNSGSPTTLAAKVKLAGMKSVTNAGLLPYSVKTGVVGSKAGAAAAAAVADIRKDASIFKLWMLAPIIGGSLVILIIITVVCYVRFAPCRA